MSDSIPTFDFICNRSLNIVKSCLSSENIVVNSVVQHGVFFSRMCSGVGRNVQFCCERYGISMSTLLDLPSKRKLRINADDDIRRVDMIKELVLVRDGKMSLSGDTFSDADIRMLIDCLSSC